MRAKLTGVLPFSRRRHCWQVERHPEGYVVGKHEWVRLRWWWCINVSRLFNWCLFWSDSFRWWECLQLLLTSCTPLWYLPIKPTILRVVCWSLRRQWKCGPRQRWSSVVLASTTLAVEHAHNLLVPGQCVGYGWCDTMSLTFSVCSVSLSSATIRNVDHFSRPRGVYKYVYLLFLIFDLWPLSHYRTRTRTRKSCWARRRSWLERGSATPRKFGCARTSFRPSSTTLPRESSSGDDL